MNFFTNNTSQKLGGPVINSPHTINQSGEFNFSKVSVNETVVTPILFDTKTKESEKIITSPSSNKKETDSEGSSEGNLWVAASFL